MQTQTKRRRPVQSDRLSGGRRIVVAILVLGGCAQLVQALLIREGLVAFSGNELSLGAFYGSWLLWIAAGAVAVTGLRRWRWVREPLPSLRRLLLLLPALLLVQVLALRSVRGLLGVSASELVPLGELFLSFAIITLPSGLALGISFPLACKALADLVPRGVERAAAPGLVSRLYVADALGALAGGVLFTFVLVQWLGFARILGVLGLALALTAWSLYARPWRRPAAWGALLLAGVGLALALLPATGALERQLELLRFGNLQPGLTLLRSVETRYGHMAVARLDEELEGGRGEQLSIVADGQIRESFPRTIEVRRDAAYFAAQAPGARRALILSGLAGGLPAALLRYPFERIDVVEPDRRAFDAVRPYLDADTLAALSDPRLGLHFQDGRRFVNRLSDAERYDLILVLAASPTSAQGNRLFTRDFYRQARDHLRAGAVLCTRVASAVGFLGSEVAGYAGSVYHTLGAVLPHLAIVPGEEQTLCASAAADRVSDDPPELARRHRAMAPGADDLPAGTFANLLDPREVAFVRARLEKAAAEINTDARPVTYYLNMLLWGQLSGSGLAGWLETLHRMGPWPYLLPPALLVALWLLRAGMDGTARGTGERRGAVLLLALLGMIAMAAQLTLLLGYQAQVGFMFERVALLNGVFMTGLALGAGAGSALARRGRPVAALAAVMALVAVVLLALPGSLRLLGAAGLWQEPGYVALALLVGLLTGTGFPLGVAITHRDRPEIVHTGGLTTAADNLGGAAGGLVTGALMLPLLGSAATCGVLAALALLALVPLLSARFLPVAPVRRGRGVRSFPWPGLGWALIYGVALAYGWHLLERGAAPGPQLRFDPARLAELAGDMRFDAVERPFVHYLGTGPGESAPGAAALASMAAAPEVRGYAGPINLLLAVDRNGTLLGVRHLHSNETPSYIAGIDTWLAGLAGADLAAGPLSLERVDGLSGATVTSRAVLAAVNRAAGRVGEAAFGSAKPPVQAPAAASLGVAFWATAALLAAALAVHLTGALRARLALLVATLAILGLWLNTPVTEIDLVNLGLGNVPPPAENPQRWLLLGYAGVTALLFGPIWCGLLCPFGALQELLSRAGRRLGLRSYPDRRVDQVARYLKYLLLALMLIAVWLSGDTLWAAFDPMQRVFGGLAGWMLVLASAALLGSLVYVRFWCRYFCPLGAFLALGNKVALLGRVAPKRRFEHCDLGVRGEYDLDCIRCARCLGGDDTRLRHRPHGAGE